VKVVINEISIIRRAGGRAGKWTCAVCYSAELL